MSDKLKDLETKVRECVSPKDAATTLINGVADELDGLTQDPVAIKALSASLRDAADTLAEAVCAGANRQYADPSKKKWEGVAANPPLHGKTTTTKPK